MVKNQPKKVSLASQRKKSKNSDNYNEQQTSTDYSSTERYPRSVWKFKKDTQKSSIHPTQKPVALITECVLTYSNEGDTVLDMTSGSMTTGEVCLLTGRNFVLIEKTRKYYRLGVDRCVDVCRDNHLNFYYRKSKDLTTVEVYEKE